MARTSVYKYEIHCVVCERRFLASRKHAKYCSMECYQKKYRATHSDYYSAYARNYNKKYVKTEEIIEKERIRGRAREKTEKRREYRRYKEFKRRSLERNSLVDYPKEAWTDTLEFFAGKCAYCGATSNITKDHFFPVIDGGATIPFNILPACRSCNSKKGKQEPFEYLFKSPNAKRMNKILEWFLYSAEKYLKKQV